jgi:hypothetical protein
MVKTKKIIFKNADSVPTPSIGDTVVFRLKNKPYLKYSKNGQGIVSEVKPSGAIEINAFLAEYMSIEKSIVDIKQYGQKAISKMIIDEYGTIQEKMRILDALDKIPSFSISLINNNLILAKARLSKGFELGYITESDYELIENCLTLAQQI